jgi:cell division transport system permease protein
MKTDQLSAWRQAHGHAALLSLGELCRRPVSSLLAWLIIAIALALPGVLALVLGNLKEMNVRWQGNIPTLSVYLQTQSSDDEAQLESEISHLPDVASFRKITPEEAMQQLQRVTQLTDLDQVLPHNPLPTVLVVRPRHSAVQQATLSALKDQLSGLNGVDFVQLDMRWVERLFCRLVSA